MRALFTMAVLLGLLAGGSAVAKDGTATVLSPSERVRMLGSHPVVSQGCCKVCRKGKACGDSCISRSKSCRAGQGCACDG